MAKVSLEQVSRRFATTNAVDQITFEVPDGQFWVLVGPSGCGKSTILRMIAGLDAATTGSIYIGERLINQVPARLRDVAMVFQNYALYPHMTVADNLGFGLKLRGTDKQTLQRQIEAVAKSLNIAHLLDRKPRQLSGGQQQRVALGRAIVRQPQVFLLDEPLSNLDAQLRDETRAELKLLHQQLGITTIYVTHDQVEAMTLADQIVVLNQGRIQQISDPQTLYTRPINQMVATFLGSPPMNILSAEYQGDTFEVGGAQLPCPDQMRAVLAGHRAVNLGIRPEHIGLAEPESAHLTATVVVIEPLGRESLVRARLNVSGESTVGENTVGESTTGEATLLLWVPASQSVQVEDRLPLRLQLEHLQVFDPTTGTNLLARAAV